MYVSTSPTSQGRTPRLHQPSATLYRSRRSLSRTWVFCFTQLLVLTSLLPASSSRVPPAAGEVGGDARAAKAGSPSPGITVAKTGDTTTAGAEEHRKPPEDGQIISAVAGAEARRAASRETVQVRPGRDILAAMIPRTKREMGPIEAGEIGGTEATRKASRTKTARATARAGKTTPTITTTPSQTGATAVDPATAEIFARGEGGRPPGKSLEEDDWKLWKRSARSVNDPAPGSRTQQGTHYNFTLAFLTAVQNNGPGKFTGGAFFLALDHLNDLAKTRLAPASFSSSASSSVGPSATFSYVFRDTHNLETMAMRSMVDLYCSDTDVSVFIGPDVFCNNAALLATSFDLPYLSYDCNDIHTLRTNIHKYLMVNLEPSLAYVAKSIVAVMRHYHWTSFWLITGTGVTSNAWTDTGQELRLHAREAGITLTDVSREDLNDQYHIMIKDQKPYRSVIEDTRSSTRVYVFLGVYNSLLEFLQELDRAGVTDGGEHVVIAVDDRSLLGVDSDGKRDYSSYFLSTEETGQEVTPSRLAALRNVLLLTRQERVPEITEEFRYHVYERNYAPPINLTKIPDWWPVKKQHKLQQESIYLYDAVMHYGKVVLELVENGEDPHNASLLTERMRNVDIDSVQGFKVHINQDGESEGRYVVRSLAYDHPHHQEGGSGSDGGGGGGNGDGTPRAEMWQVGSFSIRNGTTRYQPSNDSFVTWVSGEVPISDPVCGFDGSKCRGDDDEMAEWKVIAVGIGMAVLVILAIGAVFVGLRHFMYEQRLDRLAWKIEYSAIELLDDGQLREMISPGRPRRKVASRWKTFLASVDMLGGDFIERERRQASLRGTPDVRVGLYKGSHVVVRTVARRHVEVTRALKKALLARKEMTHENINRFIGACIEPPRGVFIVSQFCSRRSLWDILRNEDSPLDDMFITSLVQDLYKGMTFIHESELGYHGNLKSSKCLVDSRWVLKIADFGLRQLTVPDTCQPDPDDEGYCRKLMWRAPELLKSDTAPPEGTQKGDVYSFGIILYELYGLKGPWGDTHLKCTDIIRRLRSEDYASQPGVRPFRPDTSVLRVKEGVVPLMHLCWHPDPDLRPDFKNGIRLKLKPIQQGLLKSNIFDNMLAMMEKYAHNLEAVVAERTEQLSMEKRMTENLLLRMLPRSVADRLKHGKPVCPEQYESVSIYFSDIVGFTELSAQSTPMQIVDMLNDLYTCFDSIIENYDVYKVETIGDAYMVVSGLPIRNGLSHAGEVASMSLHLLASISSIRIRHRPNASIKIRIGIHSGPCCAGVVGLKMPRYCLFGDTVNTASRLETTGEALKIHCSQELKDILDRLGGYHIVERGLVDMKGKGKKLTYFLEGEDRAERMRRISHERMKLDRAGFPRDRDQRCVSVSNLDYRGKIYTMQNGMAHDLGRLPERSAAHQHRHINMQMKTIPDNLMLTGSSSSSDSMDFATVAAQHGKQDIPYYTLPSLSSIASTGSDVQGPHAGVHARRYSSDVTVTADITNGSAFVDVNSSVVSGASAGDVRHDMSDPEAPLLSPVSVGSPQICPRECEDPSEMKCLLDDGRTKVNAPSKQLTHLLHGRTPETVL